MSVPRVLVVAGSDSGGGAGLQADIQTITMLGGHATTAVTAVTAQNTVAVERAEVLPTDLVLAQIDAVLSDIGADAVKIGMIGSAETARAVAERLATERLPLVLDPVMVATSGGVLADLETVAAMGALMRIAAVVTPNLPELEALGGEGAVLREAPAVLVKGGHGGGETLTDTLVHRDGGRRDWTDARIETTSTHGTGCTLSSAIAVGLARGSSLKAAVATARRFVRLALREAPGLGSGAGPMGHGAVRLDVGEAATLNQIALPAADRAASAAFYRLIGLAPVVDEPHYVRMEAPGGVTLSLHDAEPAIYLECPDLDAEVARLRAAGLAIDDPVTQPWLWREAWTRDPGGNRVCLYQAGEARRFPPWRVGA